MNVSEWARRRLETTGLAHLEEPVNRAAGESAARSALSSSPAAPETEGHAFAVVASDSDFLGVAVPFLDTGLRRGDLVAVSASPESVELIRRELGTRASALRMDPAISLLGARAPDAMAACGRYVHEAAVGGAGVRALAEVDYGREPEDWREGQRWESAFNRLVGNSPVTALCVYDRRTLPATLVDSAVETHPFRVDGTTWSVNRGFRDPAEYVPALPRPRVPVEDDAPVLAVDEAPTLVSLRRQLGAAFAAHVPDAEQQEDLRLAASEIAANAFRHGRPPVSARVWADRERIVCAVSDGGSAFGDPFAGFVPAHGPDLGRGGMGLWLARKLWDHVDLLPEPGGLTVRLSTRLR
jgi:anti-sigma regulatory factor (Ser/Thr protein kinase)